MLTTERKARLFEGIMEYWMRNGYDNDALCTLLEYAGASFEDMEALGLDVDSYDEIEPDWDEEDDW